jgi:hypothetical protein
LPARPERFAAVGRDLMRGRPGARARQRRDRCDELGALVHGLGRGVREFGRGAIEVGSDLCASSAGTVGGGRQSAAVGGGRRR